MNTDAFWFLVIGGGMACLFWWGEGYVLSVLAALVTGGLVYFAEDIEASRLEREAKRAAQERADAVPRPISHSADGCTVYAFKPTEGARWAYFTRCTNSTTATTTTHQECTGGPKNRNCQDVPVTVQGEQ